MNALLSPHGMSKHLKLRIRSTEAPLVELTGEGSSVYIAFQASKPVARTINKSTWPVVNIDLAEDGGVIGVEAIGMTEFTIQHVLSKAGIGASKRLLSQARYVTSKEAHCAAH